MDKHPALTERRIDQFKAAQLKDRLILARVPLAIEHCAVAHPRESIAREKGPWRKAEPGFAYGPAYAESWFRVKGEVPAEWAGKEVGLVANVGGERTLWQNDVPARGIDGPHSICRLWDQAPGGAKIDEAIQVYSSAPHVRVHGVIPERSETPDKVDGAELVLLNTALYPLYYDVEFAASLMRALDPKDPAFATILRALNDVCNEFAETPEAIRACRKILRDQLGTLNSEMKHTLTPVGHAHLDTAWLWPLRVTHLKMAHTTATQLYQIERYSDYVFCHSQASQYEWLEQEYPELFRKVKAAAKRGQWEPVGSMWVEADCNLTGGESLVRQFLYGRRYFDKHFGFTTDDMWLPDVFGYSAALPQILSKFGIQYFLTQKISWNQTNKFPHNTMWWQGIDGSRVWTHFPPADTYIGDCTPKQIVESVKNHKDQSRSDASLYLFGWGDGGGGPEEMHLELLRRARTAPHLPEIEKGAKAVDFFRKAKAESRDLVTWIGEFYLEFHRGTYTSQAANKKGNRQSEFLLRDAELLNAFRPDFPGAYPHAEIERLWKLVLLNQFHDIIPGSSVTEVYEDSDRDYADIRESGTRLVTDALKAIAGHLDTSGMRRPVALFHNSTTPDTCELPWGDADPPASLAIGSERHPVQLVETFGERKLIFATPPEALGAVAVGDLSDEAPTYLPKLKAKSRRIENGEMAVSFDSSGNITSIRLFDDQEVELIEPGQLGNLFQLFDDRPLFWDAWDVDPYLYEKGRDLMRSQSFEIVERGPTRVAVEISKTFGQSRLRQRISLGPTPGIRFDTWVDWHESHQMLKVAFPLNINAARATFEIQFGHVERPTHRNTSWDQAKFEVPAQKWVDMSEGGYGVALINDCKYGYDTLGGTLRLSLLRSPKAPDPTCDMGEHRFTYMLLPHFGQIADSDVVAAAYGLNATPRVLPVDRHTGATGEMPRFVGVDSRAVVIETVKKAEDSDRLVVRMYECHNTRGRTQLTCVRGIRRAFLADLNEQIIGEVEVVEGAVMVPYKPFEIITLLIEPA